MDFELSADYSWSGEATRKEKAEWTPNKNEFSVSGSRLWKMGEKKNEDEWLRAMKVYKES